MQQILLKQFYRSIGIRLINGNDLHYLGGNNRLNNAGDHDDLTCKPPLLTPTNSGSENESDYSAFTNTGIPS